MALLNGRAKPNYLMWHTPRSSVFGILRGQLCRGPGAHLHIPGAQAVYEERHKRIQHFQNPFAGRLDLGSFQTQMQQLKDLRRHFTAGAHKTKRIGKGEIT